MDWSKKTLLESGEAKARKRRVEEEREALKCPRCESRNTKFCYYNNYNKTQPRHFCKGCKRHWTNGGTLRNVPVGGGRTKTKRRLKRPTPTPTPTSHTHELSTSNIMTSTSTPPLGFRRSSHKSEVEVTKGFEWSGPNNFGQGLNDDDVITWDSTLVAAAPEPEPDHHENQNQNQINPGAGAGLITFSSLSCFDDQIPTSFASLNNNRCESREEDSSNMFAQTWEVPTSTLNDVIMEAPNYWNWNIDVEDHTMLLADLNLIPWDNINHDSTFKP